MKTKTPNVESAAAAARAISRRLRKAGFLMSQDGIRYLREGFYAHRVGCSNLVSVSYNLSSKLAGRATDEEKSRRDEAVAKARELLAAAGYEEDTNTLGLKTGIYICCQGE